MRLLLAATLALTLAGCAGSSDEFRNRPLAANPSAFIDNNVNRVRAGAVIDLPSQASASAIR